MASSGIVWPCLITRGYLFHGNILNGTILETHPRMIENWDTGGVIMGLELELSNNLGCNGQLFHGILYASLYFLSCEVGEKNRSRTTGFETELKQPKKGGMSQKLT